MEIIKLTIIILLGRRKAGDCRRNTWKAIAKNTAKEFTTRTRSTKVFPSSHHLNFMLLKNKHAHILERQSKKKLPVNLTCYDSWIVNRLKRSSGEVDLKTRVLCLTKNSTNYGKRGEVRRRFKASPQNGHTDTCHPPTIEEFYSIL